MFSKNTLVLMGNERHLKINHKSIVTHRYESCEHLKLVLVSVYGLDESS